MNLRLHPHGTFPNLGGEGMGLSIQHPVLSGFGSDTHLTSNYLIASGIIGRWLQFIWWSCSMDGRECRSLSQGLCGFYVAREETLGAPLWKYRGLIGRQTKRCAWQPKGLGSRRLPVAEIDPRRQQKGRDKQQKRLTNKTKKNRSDSYDFQQQKQI